MRLLSVMLATGAYPAVAQALGACDAQRWVLLWSGGQYRPRYSLDSLMPFVAVVDPAGNPLRWFSTGAVILDHRASSGASLNWTSEGPSFTGADWRRFLDSIMGSTGILARLDSAVGIASLSLGRRARPFDVAIMIPYPDKRRGLFWYDEQEFDLRTTVGRLGAVNAYVSDAIVRFARSDYPHLRLAGFYWVNEGIRLEDLGAIRQFAGEVHRHRLQLLWMPDFFDFTHRHWQDVWALGFDLIFLQPNYFIDTMVVRARIDSAVSLASKSGVGLVIEFDRRLFSSSTFARRLSPYLSALDQSPALREGPLALYEGSYGLPWLAFSADSSLRQLYSHLAATFSVPDLAASCR